MLACSLVYVTPLILCMRLCRPGLCAQPCCPQLLLCGVKIITKATYARKKLDSMGRDLSEKEDPGRA